MLGKRVTRQIVQSVGKVKGIFRWLFKCLF